MKFQGEHATLTYEDEGDGRPAVLLHGFASNRTLNWVSTGWIQCLVDAGYRVIAPDLRGHGESTKFYEPEDYHPDKIAEDVLNLMDNLGLERVELMGYSMGARVSIALAGLTNARFRHIVLAGVGETLLNPIDDPEAVAQNLLGKGPQEVPPGGNYRAFAERYGNDTEALAACIRGVRVPFDEAAFADITRPTLVITGEKDTVSGRPEPLADLNRNAEAAIIPGKDHMMAVADEGYKRRVLQFIAEGA